MAPGSPQSPDSPTTPRSSATASTSAVRRLFGPLVPDDERVLPALLRNETVGGALMLVATVAALLWANIGAASYERVREVELGPLTLQKWAADGLLTLFFFVAGLELKREIISGSLSKPRDALVPIVAALTGMAVPALIYVAVNAASPDGVTAGWAIPMATDIAFAVAILALAGPHLPASLRAFLLTLAIVDDLGAILVIATVFTESIHVVPLLVALACAVLWWALQRRRIDAWFVFVPLFVITWWFMHESGVHATIAGVLLGLLTRSTADDPNDTVDRWEHAWQPVSAAFAVPTFALFTAGVAVSIDALRDVVTSPIGLGIIAGLVIGKPIGVFGGAWLTARFTRAELAADLLWREVLAVSCLAGVGFTVSLFVSELALSSETGLDDLGKASVLLASVVAAVLAAIALRALSRRRA